MKRNDSEVLSAAIRSFLGDYLPHQRACSAQTILSYRDSLKLLLKFAAGTRYKVTEFTVALLSSQIVTAFLDHLESKRRNSVATRNVRLTAIHSFFEYLGREHPEHLLQAQRILSIPFKRTTQRTVDYLEAGELRRVLEAVDRSTPMGRRDHMLLRLALQTGLRLSEIIGLHCQDVALDSGPHVRCTGKGRKSRCVPLRKDTVTMLRAWLCERNAQPDTPLFPNLRGNPLSRDGVQYVLAKHVATARQHCPSLKSKRVSPHVLRQYAGCRNMPGGTVD